MIPSVEQRPEQPDEGALEDERPADECVGRADEPHDLDLLAPRDDRQPDRVDDDEQDDEADEHQDRDAAGPEDARHRREPVDVLLDLDHALDHLAAFRRSSTTDANWRGSTSLTSRLAGSGFLST